MVSSQIICFFLDLCCVFRPRAYKLENILTQNRQSILHGLISWRAGQGDIVQKDQNSSCVPQISVFMAFVVLPKKDRQTYGTDHSIELCLLQTLRYQISVTPKDAWFGPLAGPWSMTDKGLKCIFLWHRMHVSFHEKSFMPQLYIVIFLPKVCCNKWNKLVTSIIICRLCFTCWAQGSYPTLMKNFHLFSSK